jgi:UDP-N-acetylglucosamine 1-carboxyvinyltransferase
MVPFLKSKKSVEMECLHILGGVPLKGSLRINGAKKGALPLMVASLLTDTPLVLDKIPLVADIYSMKDLLESLGTSIEQVDNTLTLHTKDILSFRASYERVRKMRASIVVLGALLARHGKAEVSLPGGCAIGVRPINFHLDGLRALGVDLDIHQGYVMAQLPSRGLPGGRYAFPKESMTGTQNLLFAAVLAKGESCLMNASHEPEITDLITCLQKMGAVIEGKGTSTLLIQGRPSLSGTQHAVLPDRIEMGTFMVAAAMTKGDLVLEGASLDLLPGVLSVLRNSGATIEDLGDNRVRVFSTTRPRPFELQTEPFPGFPTDLQAQFMALATLAEGGSSITETIWENRFMHVAELVRMGADIKIQGHTAWVKGRPHLTGAPVMATDLRASVGLVLAGLAAEGETTVRRIYHLDRGYEQIEERLKKCGARINRLTSEPQESEL